MVDPVLDTYFKQFFWSFRLLVVGAVAVLSARAVNTIIGAYLRPGPGGVAASAEPSVRATDERTHASSVPTQAFLERNLFQAEREDLAPPPTPVCACDAALDRCDQGCVCDSLCLDPSQCEKSSLRPKLTGTIVARDPDYSVAVFTDPTTNQPTGYYLGDKLIDQASLIAIEYRKVKVDNGGRCEYFTIFDEDTKGAATPVAALAAPVVEPVAGTDESKIVLGAAVKKVKDTEYEIPRSEVDGILANLNAVSIMGRIVPNFVNGKANGFKIFSIRPDSLYTKIGIENGDVIEKINGYEISSPEKALEIYSKLKDASTITVDVVRRGRKTSLNYAIR